MAVRTVRRVLVSKPTEEGGGVLLNRAFGPAEVPQFDPFLLLDDFRSERPEDYSAGFPSHPHRGFETVTYVLRGEVEHTDSDGRSGRVRAGGAQWMTAGRGIVHAEMPHGDAEGALAGFQLWVNLPSDRKMTAPRYREVAADEIPVINAGGDAVVRLLCGRVGGIRGPIRDIVTDPEFLDVSMPPGSRFVHPTTPGHSVFAYVIEGMAFFGADEAARDARPPAGRESGGFAAAGNHTVLLFDDGDSVLARTDEDPARFLLCAGRPLGEPVAWRGSIVMNTGEELRAAYQELRDGTFLQAEGRPN